MATLTADANGVVQGKFRIPPNVRAGSKLVTFTGDKGGNGQAAFVGQGTVVTNQMRKVTNVMQTYYDPLAQTFIMDSARHLAGVEVYVADTDPVVANRTPLIAQIRETQVGFPTTTILAEGRIHPAAIMKGQYVRILFDEPFYCMAGTEYALVMMCNDAVTSLGISELGKANLAGSGYVTSQPYQVGVLLSSANASTWTAHQDRDLTFRLLARKYTATSKSHALGTVTVDNATDLLVSMLATTPATGAECSFQLEYPNNGGTQTVSDGQVIKLSNPISGDIKVTALLKATPDGRASALLDPGSQIIAGTIQPEGVYISRAFPGDKTQKVTPKAYLSIVKGPNDNLSFCNVFVALDATTSAINWVPMKINGTPVPGNIANMQDYEFIIDSAKNGGSTQLDPTAIPGHDGTVRVKIELKGTAGQRIYVTSLRVSLT